MRHEQHLYYVGLLKRMPVERRLPNSGTMPIVHSAYLHLGADSTKLIANLDATLSLVTLIQLDEPTTR
jgi:hypothetical protein